MEKNNRKLVFYFFPIPQKVNIYAKQLPHLKKVRQLMLLFEQTTDDVCFHAFKDYYFCYGFVAQAVVLK